jgi:hypothetical protein
MSPTEIYTDPDSTLAKKFYDILIATDNDRVLRKQLVTDIEVTGELTTFGTENIVFTIFKDCSLFAYAKNTVTSVLVPTICSKLSIVDLNNKFIDAGVAESEIHESISYLLNLSDIIGPIIEYYTRNKPINS